MFKELGEKAGVTLDLGRAQVVQLLESCFKGLPPWLRSYLTQVCSWLRTVANTRTAKVALFGGCSVASLLLCSKLRQWHIRRLMAARGCHLMDPMAQIYQRLHQFGEFPTINGFELCDDSLTLAHARDFCQQLLATFVNFRCAAHYAYGQWWFRRLQASAVDLDTHLEYIDMDSLECCALSGDDDSDDALLDSALDAMNQKGLSVDWPKWAQAKKPHWICTYLHFKSAAKCIMYWRVDHSILDGFLGGALAQMMHDKLYAPESTVSGQCDGKLITNSLFTQMAAFSSKMPKPTFLMKAKYLATIPRSVVEFIKFGASNPDPTNCSVNGDVSKGKGQLAVSRVIAIAELKRVAKSNNATMTELFNTLVSRTLRRYMEQSGDALLEDEKWRGYLRGVTALNLRPLDPMAFNDTLETFAESGSKALMLSTIPVRFPIRGASIASSRVEADKVKYTYYPMLFRHVTMALTRLPLPSSFMDSFIGNNAHGNTVIAINLIGPSQKLAIPGERATVDAVFGMTASSATPLSFAMVSYAEGVRVGICANSVVANPKLLQTLFSEEYEVFKRGECY